MAEKKSTGNSKLLKFILIPEVTSIATVLIVAVIAAVLNPVFLRAENLLTLTSSLIASWGIIAIGEALLIMSGGLDVSLGNIMTFAAMMFCYLARNGWPLWLCIAVVFAIAICMELVNGLLILKFGVAPFVATMSMQFVGEGLSNVVNYGADLKYTMGASEVFLKFNELLSARPLGLSIGAIVFVVLIFVAQFILKKTAFGRQIYAVGDNPRVARVAGIRVVRVRTACFIIAGFLTGLAAVLWVGYYGGCTPTQGNPWTFITIAAAAMGGISLRGGSGSMFGLFFGVVLMGLVYNLITLLGISLLSLLVLALLVALLVVEYQTLPKTSTKA